MRVYVASAFSNKDETRLVQQDLVDAGHTISHDWTKEDASHLAAGSPEFFAFLERCGADDIHGVLTADAVVVVAHPDMRDTRAEMGIAIGAGVPVLVLYPWRAHSVFYGSTIRVKSLPEMRHALYDLEQLLP